MCNAFNHPRGCRCGWGGEGHLGSGHPPAQADHNEGNFYRPTTCPRCGKSCFFVRHNDGSFWVDAMGWPWPKHPCFDDDGVDYRTRLRHVMVDQLVALKQPQVDESLRLCERCSVYIPVERWDNHMRFQHGIAYDQTPQRVVPIPKPKKKKKSKHAAEEPPAPPLADRLKPLRCRYCKTLFYDRAEIQQHIKKYHPIEPRAKPTKIPPQK